MKALGLISLLITVGLMSYFAYNGNLAFLPSKDQASQSLDIESPIDQAKEAVVILEKKSSAGSVVVYDGEVVPSDTEILDLSGQALSGSLKAEIRHLQQLRTLDISDNNFTGIPAEVGQLSLLQVLDVSNNPITGLPQEIGNLQQLKTLDLRGTKYSQQDLDIIKASLPETTEILVD